MQVIELPEPVLPTPSAEALNALCHCRTLDRERLLAVIDAEAGLSGLGQRLSQTHPHLFSATSVFISAAVAARIADSIAAIERVIALPTFQARALARAPAIAAHDHGPQGVLMGYDFHLSPQGPRLIEINTNAGGLLVNLALSRAQAACCAGLREGSLAGLPLAQLEAGVVAMFRSEWRAQRGEAPLGTVAIVDDDPEAQYLAPEFALFRRVLEGAGIEALIADARALAWRDGRLWAGARAIDLCYNRVTDFYLEDPAHAALRDAYAAGAVVLTPHPRAHALHADKRNLVLLGDGAGLAELGVPAADRALLAAVVPATREVAGTNAEALWADRRHWFFKPAASYGSKAAYRGDKLTRRVWAEIQAGGFIAQQLVPPGERVVELDGQVSDLKFDLRAYTYAGRILLLAARIYSGQTTNFRTPGGGFAPVVVIGAG